MMNAATGKSIRFKNPIVIILLFLVLVLTAAMLGRQFVKGADDASGLPPRLEFIPGPAIPPADSAYYSGSCQAWYDKYLARSCFNGGILVAKNGHIVFERYKGEEEPGNGIPFSDTSSIHIASVSKTFTAMAVLKLAQEGKLNLDDSAARFFPGFPYPGVTVRNLLNHRSGLPNYLNFMEATGWNKNEFMRNADILKTLSERKPELENIGVAGKHFSYCNTNYALLALIVEKVSGMDFPSFMQKNFFTPLGMDHSFVFNPADSARAHGSYECSGRKIPDDYRDRVYGDKNIYSCPGDMLLWDRALRSGRLFNQESLAEAYAPYSNEKPGQRNYGLGWRMYLLPDDRKIIYHNGWWHGSNAAFIRLLDEDAVIIVLGSRYSRLVYKAKELVNLFVANELPEEEE